MSRKFRLLGVLHVLSALILSYVAQVSHVSAEQVSRWTLHDWVSATLLITYAGISAWKAFIVNPHGVANVPFPPAPVAAPLHVPAPVPSAPVAPAPAPIPLK